MVNEIGVGTSHKTFYSREFFIDYSTFFIEKKKLRKENYVYIQTVYVRKIVQEM